MYCFVSLLPILVLCTNAVLEQPLKPSELLEIDDAFLKRQNIESLWFQVNNEPKKKVDSNEELFAEIIKNCRFSKAFLNKWGADHTYTGYFRGDRNNFPIILESQNKLEGIWNLSNTRLTINTYMAPFFKFSKFPLNIIRAPGYIWFLTDIFMNEGKYCFQTISDENEPIILHPYVYLQLSFVNGDLKVKAKACHGNFGMSIREEEEPRKRFLFLSQLFLYGRYKNFDFAI